jgi:hypothetical protein
MKYFNTGKYKHSHREDRFAAGLKKGVLAFVDTKSHLKPKRR